MFDKLDFFQLLPRLRRSKFRSKFKLDQKDLDYIEKVGMEKIKQHAQDFIEKRLAPAEPPNDGRQTPFKGHPVFKAQHATATCCRSCLLKWHSIPKGRALTADECQKIIDILLAWIVWQTNSTPEVERSTNLNPTA
ncbi:MAG: DUF4186 domain-containing protein [Candidatus Omnitrophica bacterium]|jgi:exodeoxyribonuclease V alpha subunit|nr:DUF4186 domain-containing protein [Candidatus Omnitrophota bacterium]